MLGASVREDTVTFAVWAPRCRSVDVAIEGRRPQPMTRGADDVFTLTVPNVALGEGEYAVRALHHRLPAPALDRDVHRSAARRPDRERGRVLTNACAQHVHTLQ